MQQHSVAGGPIAQQTAGSPEIHQVDLIVPERLHQAGEQPRHVGRFVRQIAEVPVRTGSRIPPRS